MYQKQNNQQQLSCPAERAKVKSYLVTNFWLYLILSVLHFGSFTYLYRLGNTQKSVFSVFYGIIFIVAAIRTKGVENRLTQPQIGDEKFKKTVEGLMCLNWVIIIINAGALIFILIFVVILKKADQTAGNNYGMWPIIAGATHTIAVIIFVYQITKHKDINGCLVKIRAEGDLIPDQMGASQSGYGFDENL